MKLPVTVACAIKPLNSAQNHRLERLQWYTGSLLVEFPVAIAEYHLCAFSGERRHNNRVTPDANSGWEPSVQILHLMDKHDNEMFFTENRDRREQSKFPINVCQNTHTKSSLPSVSTLSLFGRVGLTLLKMSIASCSTARRAGIVPPSTSNRLVRIWNQAVWTTDDVRKPQAVFWRRTILFPPPQSPPSQQKKPTFLIWAKTGKVRSQHQWRAWTFCLFAGPP